MRTMKLVLGCSLFLASIACSHGSRLSDDRQSADYVKGDRAPLPGGDGGNVATAVIGLATNPNYYKGNSELRGKCMKGARDSIQFSVPCKGLKIGLATLTDDRSIREVPSDTGGAFSFPNLLTGQYRVYVKQGEVKQWFGPFTTNQEFVIVLED